MSPLKGGSPGELAHDALTDDAKTPEARAGGKTALLLGVLFTVLSGAAVTALLTRFGFSSPEPSQRADPPVLAQVGPVAGDVAPPVAPPSKALLPRAVPVPPAPVAAGVQSTRPVRAAAVAELPGRVTRNVALPIVPAGPDQPPAVVAEEAYPFVGTTLDGERLALEDLRGRPVVLTFFMIGCSLCWDDLPVLEEFQARHQHDGTAFVLISSESAEDTRARFARHPVNMPIIPDLAGVIRAAYPGMGYPNFVVIDPKGRYFASTTFGNVNDDIAARLNEAWSYVQSDPKADTVRPPAKPEGDCRLAGRVVFKDSRAPVLDANLVFWQRRPVGGTFAGLVRRTFNGDDGRFAIESVPCDSYDVSVWAQGAAKLWLKDVASVREGSLAPFEMNADPTTISAGRAARSKAKPASSESARKPATPRFNTASEAALGL
jgi:peroxiredoxin